MLSFEFATKIECFSEVRKLFEFIPDNNLTDTEILEADLNKVSENLNTIYWLKRPEAEHQAVYF